MRRLRTIVTALLLLGATAARAEPALWAIHGPHATVYLFGSSHLLRPGLAWEGAALRRAFDTADECWFEVDIPADLSALAPLLMQLGYDLQHNLSDQLPPEQVSKLQAAVADAGLRPAAVESMRPWLAAFIIIEATLTRAGYETAEGVDQILQDEAKAAGKPVHGFETMEEQLRELADLRPELGLRLLASTLDDASTGVALMDSIIEHWMAGDTAAVDEAVAGRMRREEPALYRALIADRNTAWVGTIADMLAGDKTVLVTVGAGHLVGEGSLTALLEARGIAVERVQ